MREGQNRKLIIMVVENYYKGLKDEGWNRTMDELQYLQWIVTFFDHKIDNDYNSKTKWPKGSFPPKEPKFKHVLYQYGSNYCLQLEAPDFVIWLVGI